MARTVLYTVPFKSTMVGDQTVLEIPVEEIDPEILDNLHKHIEDTFPLLEERDIIHAVNSLVDQNVKNAFLSVLVPYKKARKTTERVDADEAMARYNSRGFDYVDDPDSEDER